MAPPRKKKKTSQERPPDAADVPAAASSADGAPAAGDGGRKKQMKVSAIKMCLMKHLTVPKSFPLETAEEFRDEIEHWCDIISFGAFRGSVMLNIYLMELLESNKPFPKSFSKRFFYTFFSGAVRRVNRKRKKVKAAAAAIDVVAEDAVDAAEEAEEDGGEDAAEDVVDGEDSTDDNIHDVRDFIRRYSERFGGVPDDLRFQPFLANVLVHATDQYRTNAENMYTLQLVHKVERYIRAHFGGASRYMQRKAAREILDLQYDNSPSDADAAEVAADVTEATEADGERLREFVATERQAYLTGGATQWERWLRYAYKLLMFFKARKDADPEARGCKLFDLFPKHKTRRNFIRIDNDTIRRFSGNNVSLADCFPKFRCVFSSIMTDGIAVVFYKPQEESAARRKRGREFRAMDEEEQKRHKEAQKKQWAENAKRKREADKRAKEAALAAARAEKERIENNIPRELPPGFSLVGVDCGRRNLVSVAYKDAETSEWKTREYGRGQWTHEAGTWQHGRWVEQRMNANPAVQQLLNDKAQLEVVSPQCSVAACDTHSEWLWRNWQALWDFSTKRVWGRKRMGLYMRKQRAMEHLVATVVPANDQLRATTIVAVGSASFGSHGVCGEIPVPVQAAQRAMEKRLPHYCPTEEFRTTLLCHYCHWKLVVPRVKKKDHATPHMRRSASYDPEDYFTPHDYRHCANVNCCNHGVTVNRDGNAAMSIARNYLLPPLRFRRGVKLEPTTTAAEAAAAGHAGR